jgi:hypothetical protein
MQAIEELIAQAAPGQESAGRKVLSLAEYYENRIDPAATLLGRRFLCREGGLLFVGPSGVGKSSASVQQDVCWALGRPAFGIEPARPLRILCVQAENDAGDMHEMAQGVIDGLKLTAADREALRERTRYASQKACTGQAFFDVLRHLLESYKPDLVRIDPLQAYLGGDPKDSALISWFCRESLNPLLEQYGAAAIVNHHTPKTNFRETATWKPSDWMYAGAGAADLTNWARAVLVIDPSGGDTRGLYRFIAAKRGGRIGWRNKEDEPIYERHFQHARESGAIYWEDADAPARGTRHIPTKEELLALVPEDEPIRKDALTSKAASAGIGEKKVRGFIGELLGDGKLHEWTERRPRVRPVALVSRQPQREQMVFEP